VTLAPLGANGITGVGKKRCAMFHRETSGLLGCILHKFIYMRIWWCQERLSSRMKTLVCSISGRYRSTGRYCAIQK
jgi:hypothetical protein